VFNSEFTAFRAGAQASACSIRWKAFWVEAASSLYGGGESAALASGSSLTTSSKGGGVGASEGVRKHLLVGSSVERPAALAGREVERPRARISSRRMVPFSRVPTSDTTGAQALAERTSKVGESSW